MNDTKKITIAVVTMVVIIAGAVVLTLTHKDKPGKYDEFATCIKDSGAIFYGAFWCPHCQAEKKLFGTSAKLLPYVECSTADGKAQTQICIDKKIESYPTWIFADGSQETGEVSLATLSEKTNCPIDGVVQKSDKPSTATTASPATSAVTTE